MDREAIDLAVMSAMHHWMLTEIGEVGGEHTADANIDGAVMVADLIAAIRDLTEALELEHQMQWEESTAVE